MNIFLYGADTFSSQQKLKELKDRFIKEVDKSALNLQILDGADIEISNFRQAVLAQPFLAKKRMIIVENFFKKPQARLCHDILKTLNETTSDNMIVFWDQVVDPKKLNEGATALFKKLANGKYSYKFELLDRLELKKWLTAKIKKAKGKINSEAADNLVDWSGSNLWQLNSEVEKLLSFCKNREISNNDLDLLTVDKLEENIFKLTDALGSRNKVLALKLLRQQLASEMPETMLLSKMVWQFKNLLLIKSFCDSNSPQDYYQIANKLGLHPFIVKKALAQIKNFSLIELKKIYQQLLQVDFSIKTSQVPAKTLFDLLVAKL